MNRYFTSTFFKFFFGFLVILAVAFGILLYSANQVQTQTAPPVDNFAQPQ